MQDMRQASGKNPTMGSLLLIRQQAYRVCTPRSMQNEMVYKVWSLDAQLPALSLKRAMPVLVLSKTEGNNE